MLHIKQKHHLIIPRVALPHSMHFTPVPDDADELSTAIAHDPLAHDNQWELVERPDTTELEAYWTKVEDDIQHDPEWFSFTDDNQALV